MTDPEERSLELEKEVEALEQEFEQGLRDKELMMNELGISTERLATFEDQLSPEDKRVLGEKRREVEDELERIAPTPQPPSPKTKFKAPRGIKI